MADAPKEHRTKDRWIELSCIQSPSCLGGAASVRAILPRVSQELTSPTCLRFPLRTSAPARAPSVDIALTRGSWRALAKWRAALVAVCLHARMCPCVHAYHDITHMPGSSMLRPVLCWQFATAWSSQQLWGYRPHAAFKYIEALQQGSFSCFDGSAVLPADAVNDDFCDCADGSDEPGTPACAGVGLFYCRNAESIPKLIYSSHVADGICDCCDGSDEWSSSCPNTCSLDGPVLRAQQQLGIEAPHCCPGFPVS